MPWLPCNVQQKWSSGCPAEWFGNWGSNKHRSCWLLTIDWDWSCGVPKMLCFPSQFIICWRELGVLMSEFCTTISWVCKRQNWSKPNRMWTVLSEKHVIVICSSINMMCHFSRVWHHGQSTYIYILVWRIHKQTHAIHTCRMHTKLRKNTPKCLKFTTIFFCSMGVSNKTVMVSLGSIVANTTLKTWEPAITPPPSAPFMSCLTMGSKKIDVMSCNSWFVQRFLCLCQFSFPTTRFVRLELFMRSVRMHFVKNQVKQQNWFTHHNRKKLSGCISHEPLATAAVLLFSPCHESLSKFRDEPLCVFVMFVVVQR